MVDTKVPFHWGRKNENYAGPTRASQPTGVNIANRPTGDFDAPDLHDQEHQIIAEMFFSPRPQGRTDMTLEEAVQGHDDRIDDLRDLAETADTGPEILAAAQSITTDETYLAMMSTREKLAEVIETKTEEFQKRNTALNDAVADGYIYPEAGDLYTRGQELVELDEQSKAMNKLLDDYRNLSAETLRRYHEQSESNVVKYDKTTLGDLVDGGSFESGSREWLEFRQGGVGGSDIGVLADTRSPYYRDSVQEIWESKVNPITDEEVESQQRSHTEVTDAVSRGDALEEFIGELYALDNPDVTVMHNKSTWVDPNSPVRINYDFMLSSNGVDPDGTLEIKTSTNPDHWGDTADGIDGVPKNYRAQALAQCHQAGFTHGAVAVLINDTDFRTYSFQMTPDLIAEAEKNKQTATEFYDKTQRGEGPFPPSRSRNAFSAKESGPGMPKEKKRLLRSLARLRGNSLEEVTAEYSSRLDDDNYAQAIADTYRDSVLKAVSTGGSFTGLDLETTGQSALRSRIIELGMVHQSPSTGHVSGGYSSLYGLSPVSMAATGTGPEEVHHISASDIAGKPDFQDPGVQAEVMRELTRNRVMVAHNATFEKRYLRAHLKGFAEAEARGDIVVFDTMELTRKAMTTPDATMKSFTTANGVTYEDAHRARTDAEMMMNAFHNWVEAQQ